jgi:ketosteroid isomerase-like protein
MTTLSPNAQLAVRCVTLQGDRNFDPLWEMCAADIVSEAPYHPNGPQIYRGIDVVIKEFTIVRVFQTFKIEVVDVFDTGGEVVIVEGRSHGTYKSGRPDYRNHYLFVAHIVDGKITRWREFYNPLEAMKQNLGKPRPQKTAS